MFIRVVLPAPFSPSSPRISPRSSVRSMSSLARRPAKLFEMPRISISGAGIGSVGGRRRLVDIDAEGAVEDLPLLLLHQFLHIRRQLLLEDMIGREIGAALGHA